MARPIVLSNGRLHVGLNQYGLVHDFYYPYVGFENHAAGPHTRHRIGVWTDGIMSWLDDDAAWEFTHSYPHTALIGHTTARNLALGVVLEFDDMVDCDSDVFMRNIHVINTRDHRRTIRLFMHQAFVIGDSRSNTDTCQYLPDNHALLHYRGRRVFIVSAESGHHEFDQYSIGLFDIEGREGTYRDADDGELSMSAVEHGRVDSTLRLMLDIDAQDSARASYWIAAGTTLRQAMVHHRLIQREGVHKHFEATHNWWQHWLRPTLKFSSRIPAQYRSECIRSAMIIKSHCDSRGAVIASTDTNMLNYSRDAYGYCWPRDGAYAVWPLMRLGYQEEPLNFFTFCRRNLHPNGYLMHKYRADGALGSSWHPYLHANGQVAPPIQEDETALVLFVFVQFYQLHPSAKLLHDYYADMVVPMAGFLAEYIDTPTGLPAASYDLWEQKFYITTYTTAVVYAALQAAAELADAAHDAANAVRWREAAQAISEAAHQHLYDGDSGQLVKGLYYQDGQRQRDTTPDIATFFGVFMYGLFAPDSPEFRGTLASMEREFAIDGTRGIPRFADDAYNRSAASGSNAWPVTTLWMAQYYLESGDRERALGLLEWVRAHAWPSGVMAEQVDLATDQIVSVAPLTWSHAEYISTLLDMVIGAKQ